MHQKYDEFYLATKWRYVIVIYSDQFICGVVIFILFIIIGQLPNEFLHIIDNHQFDLKPQEKPPSIFITSHEPNNQNNLLDDMFARSSVAPPLTVQTQNMHCNNNNSNNRNTLGPYSNQLPPSPSPSMLVSDDELDNTSSLYSPNSPHTPRNHQHQHHHHQHSNSYSSTTSSSSFINTPLDPLAHR